MKTKKQKNNTLIIPNKTQKKYRFNFSKKYRFFNFSDKSHLSLIQDSLETHNVPLTIEIIKNFFAKKIIEKIQKKSKFLLDFETKIFKDLKIKPKSEKKLKQNTQYSSFVSFKVNNDKLTFLVKHYLSVDYDSYNLFLYKFNDIQTYDDSSYNIEIEMNSSNPNEIYISQINKTKYMSGSKAIKIAIEFAKLLNPKLITIIDAAYLDNNNNNNNINNHFKYTKKKEIPLSILRLLSKDSYDLSWYNSFGFQIDHTKANNSFFNYDQIKSDLDKVRNISVEKFLNYLQLLFDKKNSIFVTINNNSIINYDDTIFDKNNKILLSLFEKMKDHKIFILKDFINKLTFDEKYYFINLFFNKSKIFVGILINKHFYKSPFYNYLYILKYVGGFREMKLD